MAFGFIKLMFPLTMLSVPIIWVRAATRCSTLQRTATHCNTLQHTATHWRWCSASLSSCFHLTMLSVLIIWERAATQCNTLQRTSTHCNTLQHHSVTSWQWRLASFSFCVATARSPKKETRNGRRNWNRNPRWSKFKSLFKWAVWKETRGAHRNFRLSVPKKMSLEMVVEIEIEILDGHHRSLFKWTCDDHRGFWFFLWKETCDDHHGFWFRFRRAFRVSFFRERAVSSGEI